MDGENGEEPDDLPPPLVTDSEGEGSDEENDVAGTTEVPTVCQESQPSNQDWFLESEALLGSLVVDATEDVVVLNETKCSLETVAESVLSNQFELFETYPDILGVSLEMFLESRWTPFLKKLVPKYQTVIDHLSALYAGLVKESSDLLEEGRKTLESVVYEEGQSLSVVRDQLLSVKDIADRLSAQTISLQNASSPLHMNMVQHTLESGEACLILANEQEEEEQSDSNDQTSPYFKAMDVVNSAENVSLECGDMVGKLNNLLSVLMEAVSSEQRKVYRSLEELESWLTNARQLLYAEPQRMFEGKPATTIESSTGDEIEEVEEDTEDPELLLQSQSPSEEEDGEAEEPPTSSPPSYEDIYADSPGLPPPILSSDDEKPSGPHKGSVDIDPDDLEFVSKVEEHIFSPEVMKNPLSLRVDIPEAKDYVVTHTEITDLDEVGNKAEDDVGMATNGDEELTPTHNVKKTAELPDSEKSKMESLPVLKAEGEEFSPVDIGSGLYDLDKTLEGEYEEEEESGEECYGDDSSYGETGSKPGSEEESSTRTDESNLEWIKNITVFEYRQSVDEGVGYPEGVAEEEEDECMTYGLLINELEVVYSQIPAKAELEESVLMDGHLLMDCLPSPEEKRLLQMRLENVSQEWGLVGPKLMERICQLKFEWSQTELIMWFQETIAELQDSPTDLLLSEDMQRSLENFMDFFEDVDQIAHGEGLVAAIHEAIDSLLQFERNEEKLKRVVAKLEEAYVIISDKISEQREFLQYAVDTWKEFDSVATPLKHWVETVEVEVLNKDSFGQTLEQSEQFMREVVAYRQELPDKYQLLKSLVTVGNDMNNMVEEASPAHQCIDDVVRGTTARWEELVERLKGTEEELSNVLITWQEYNELYSAAQDFIGHIDDIAGREPLESSLGDEKLLPKFVQLQSEVDNFESRMARLKIVKAELLQNSKVGAKHSFDDDMTLLEKEWLRVEDVAQGSLDALWAEHSEWVKERLEMMESLVSRGQGLLDDRVRFAQNYPLKMLLSCQADQLLEEVQDMLTSQEELLFELKDSLSAVQSEVEIREKMIQDFTNKKDLPLSGELIEGVMLKWEEVEATANGIRPALQLYCSQLQLVCPLQEMISQIGFMESATGSKTTLEETLKNSRPAFSTAKFETLKQLSYDLDTVYREQYVVHVSDTTVQLPSNQELQDVHQILTNIIPQLNKQSKDLQCHLMLMVEWWKEYEQGLEAITDWFTDIRASISDLSEKMHLQELSPHELFEIAQELQADFQSHEEQYLSLTSTAQNLLLDMESKQQMTGEFSSQLIDIKNSWSEVKELLTGANTQLKKECEELDAYLEKLGDYSERLNAVYAEFYDELCTAIPPNASQENINRQKQILEKFNKKIAEMEGEFCELKEAGKKWGSKAIPEKWMEEFRELSPGIDDSGSESSHQSVDRQLSTSENRLKKMNQMLEDRALQLELTQGDTATLIKSANELLDWVESTLGQDFLHERPPGELDMLLHNSEELKSIKESFESRKKVLERLHQLASNSKGTLSEANLKKIESLMAKLDSAWEKMEESVVKTAISTEEVLAKVGAFNVKFEEYDTWLKQAEQTLQDCLPIEANLERLEEQGQLLDSLNTSVLEHKRTPEELLLEADSILEVAQEGTGKELKDKTAELQKRFSSVEDLGAESAELCEEAKGDVQSYRELEKEFRELMEQLEESFDALKNKPKKPIGNIQETLNEHFDFCLDVESKNDVFNKMYEFGLRAVKRYPPSEKFLEDLCSLLDQWETYVNSLVLRWTHILRLKEMWKEFETTVKDFLEWLMAEAKSFSKDVTTLGGEKGVFDHMNTCERLKTALGEKKVLLDQISDIADDLQEEDGEKPNGTKDVDSRLNDVSIHWNSICQLLSETLQTLASVYKKLVLINDITDNVSDWLNEMRASMANKRSSHGAVDVIKDEIELFKGYLEQFEEYRPSIVVIRETEAFVIEHTSCREHEDIRRRIGELVEMFETLEESGKEYVVKLEKSVPLWEMFNKHKTQLSQWLQKAQQTYESNDLKPGNATVTKRSLGNTEALYEDIQGHLENVQIMNELVKELSDLCVAGDQDFISDHANTITAHVEILKDDTANRKDLLETRMESWKAFPVKEAVEVQEFLDAVGKEVEDDFDMEGCTGDELLERLKRLEMLQTEQSRRRTSMATLDQSVDSEEVQKALAKNPDISKERSNLLRGWSSSSSQLNDKLQMLRLTADMTVSIEKRARICLTVLEKYQSYLLVPLPHSPALEYQQTQWLEREGVLRTECDEVVKDLTDVHDDYDDNPRIQVPKRLADQVNDMKAKHKALTEQADELKSRISDRMQSWEMFKQTLESLSLWLEGSSAELKDISRFYMYLSSFQDILDRHKLIQRQLKAKAKEHHYLQQNYQHHLALDRKSSVLPPTVIGESGSTECTGEEELQEEKKDEPEASEKKEEEQQDSGESLGGVIELSPQDEAAEEEEEEEEEEGDMTQSTEQANEDVDPELLQYQAQWVAVNEKWSSLDVKLEEFLVDKEPWEKMADLYQELDEWKDDMEEQVDATMKRGEEIFRLDKNPGPLTERYKHFQDDIVAKGQMLTELHSSLDQHLTQDLRTMHLPVREFVTCYDMLRDKWNILKGRVEHLTEDAVEKMEAWERRASDCIRRVPILEGEVNDKTAQIMTLEERIGLLQNRPLHRPTSPPVQKTSCIRRLFKFIIFLIPLIFILILLSSILVVLSLDGGARYRLFYSMQHLPFFELFPEESTHKLVL